MIKVLYRPLGLLVSTLGGILAGAAFKQVWTKVGSDGEPPEAKNADVTWRQVLPAAALHGAVFGAVKAAVDRGGLKGFEKATGVWAGN